MIHGSTPDTTGAGATASVISGWALSYAARGMAVFPLHTPGADGCSCNHRDCDRVGKHPRTMNGLDGASTDPAQIVHWWDIWPDANIAIATGASSDLAVLDVDGPTGEASLGRLPGELPITWTVLTGGGFHFCFRMPAFELRNSASKIGPGLDVRATRGYVVAPPSLHANGMRYSFGGRGHARARWPEWLGRLENEAVRTTEAARAEGPRVSPRGDRYVQTALERELVALLATSKGDRNHRLNVAAFNLFRFPELDALSIGTTLLDAARKIGLPENEAAATIKSAREARGR